LYYQPGGSLVRKLFEGLRGALHLGRVVLKGNAKIVHARAHPPALMAYPVVKILRRKLLFDVRGLIADEYADIGRWPRSGFLFRFVKMAEGFLFRHADALVFLTRAIVQDLRIRGALSARCLERTTIIPCCVQVPAAAPAPRPSEFVLAYVGKLGSWYLDEEILRFYLALRMIRHEAKLMVLTQSPSGPLRERLATMGLSDDDVWIGAVAHTEVPNRLREACAAVAFYKGGYSKLATSPTKLGEYLSAGLPVVINVGIGDCDELLSSNRIGVSLHDFSEPRLQEGVARLVDLVESPGVRERCRSVARRELDLDTVGVGRYQETYKKLIA